MVAQCMFDFPGQQEGDLTMAPGDVIIITGDMNEEWWEGCNEVHPCLISGTAQAGAFLRASLVAVLRDRLLSDA